MTDTNTKERWYYIDKGSPQLGGYTVEASEDGRFRWMWAEVAKDEEYLDFGPWRNSRADALRAAADDWEDNGDSLNGRLAGTLRALATRAEVPADV